MDMTTVWLMFQNHQKNRRAASPGPGGSQNQNRLLLRTKLKTDRSRLLFSGTLERAPPSVLLTPLKHPDPVHVWGSGSGPLQVLLRMKNFLHPSSSSLEKTWRFSSRMGNNVAQRSEPVDSGPLVWIWAWWRTWDKSDTNCSQNLKEHFFIKPGMKSV